MSLEYDSYLKTHRLCVVRGVSWILDRIALEKLNDIFPTLKSQELLENVFCHDESKYSSFEYGPYDDYFYGKRTEEVKKRFDYAWLHHLHNNPHHWQYWILKEDDSMASNTNMEIKCLAIPDVYILEMVADWWSFSWKNYLASHDRIDLYSVFVWYEAHIDKIAMNPKSREKVEALLNLIHDILDNSVSTIEIV